MTSRLNVSFSGGGFLGSFHVGALSYLIDAAVVVEAWTGASVGSIVAAAAATGIAPAVLDARLESVLQQVRRNNLGAFHPGFHLVDHVRAELQHLLPHDAHELARNRLFISVARRDGWRLAGTLISEFPSRAMLVDVICASCNLPGFSGALRPRAPARNSTHGAHALFPLDGGLTANFPIVPNGCPTVLVSPFPGKFDISPAFDETTNPRFLSYQGNAFEISRKSAAFWARATTVPSVHQAQLLRDQGYAAARRYFERLNHTKK